MLSLKQLFSVKLFFVVILIVFLGLTSKAYENNALSFHFVDEEDNFVLGKYLLNGEKLYSNLFSHHQPLGYIFSASVQKVTRPNSIFLLVKRHREFIIIWSVIWSLFLYFRFGKIIIPFISIYELTKIFLLGNLFLAESLVVYPTSYLTFLIISKENLRKVELFFLGICFSFVALMLAPMWPLLLLILILFFLKFKAKKWQLSIFFLGILPLVLISLFFISVPDYFFNALYINFHYYIPLTSEGNISIKSFLSPLIALFEIGSLNPTGVLIKWLSLVLLINLGMLLFKRRFLFCLTIFLSLGFSNIRYIDSANEYYNGFHLLPWFAILIISCCLSSQEITKYYKSDLLKKLVLFIFGFTIVLSLFLSKDTLFMKRDQNKDWYINYSRQFDAGEIIRITKSPTDTLFVAPDEWLVYWQADISHASKMLNYYGWMSNVPVLKSEVDNTFLNNPPDYFYCDCGQTIGLNQYLSSYKKVRKNGSDTQLYIKTNKFSNLNNTQKNQLKYIGVEIN